jgi:hypothetical protein
MPPVRYLIYFGHALLLINALLYIKSYRKNSVAFNIFTFYLSFILIIQLITSYKGYFKENNIYLSHYYFIGQFVLLSLLFKKILKKRVLQKVITIILIFTLIALSVFYIIYPSSYYQFNIFEILLTSIPLILFCFLFFIQTIDGSDKKFIYIISGFFLYVLCSTLLFSAGNLEKDTRNIIWWTNSILYLVYQLLIFVEWYKHLKKPIKKLPVKTIDYKQ